MVLLFLYQVTWKMYFLSITSLIIFVSWSCCDPSAHTDVLKEIGSGLTLWWSDTPQYMAFFWSEGDSSNSDSNIDSDRKFISPIFPPLIWLHDDSKGPGWLVHYLWYAGFCLDSDSSDSESDSVFLCFHVHCGFLMAQNDQAGEFIKICLFCPDSDSNDSDSKSDDGSKWPGRWVH